MGFFKDRENYLKQLCIDHSEVQHTVEVDEVVRNSFFRVNNEEELVTATFQNIHFPAVAFMDMAGRLTDRDNALVDIRHVIKYSFTCDRSVWI